MNIETITQKLHSKADRDLRARLEKQFGDLFQETLPNSSARPKLGESQELDGSVNQACYSFGNGNKATEIPWIGAVSNLHKELCFAYLAPRWRDRYVREFMEKVEAMQRQIDEIGGIE